MKQIPLNHGLFALVDDKDFEELSKYKWLAHKSKSGRTYYAERAVRISDGKQKIVAMHRQILGLNDPKVHTDHINGNGLDNRRENLRACSQAENLRNQQLYKNNTTGFKGVLFHKRDQKYYGQIKLNGKATHLGIFLCPIEAAKAYDEAAKRLHGEFARLNFPA